MHWGKVALFMSGTPLMVIDDFYIENAAVLPAEADVPLVVDADAPLPGSVAGELLEEVAGRDAQEIETGGGAELDQLALGDALHVLRQFSGKPAVEKLFGPFAEEVANHKAIVSTCCSIVNRLY
nr:hypothetical protein [Desulfuromonas sp.]